MGFLSRLFGLGAATPETPLWPRIRGDGKFSVNVVGESFYTEEFRAIFGPLRRADNEDEAIVDAELHLDDNNPHDANAVAVRINGRQIGHLDKRMAIDFRDALRRDKLSQYRQFIVRARVYMGGDDEQWSAQLDLPEA